jgi:hypothetical protein
VGPVLVAALVILAALAGSGSYYVTRQLLAGESSAIAGSGPGSTTAPVTGATTPATAPTTPGAPSTTVPAPTATATKPSVSPSASGKDPATFCPALTEQAVRAAGLAGGLQLLRYVQGDGTGSVAGAEAWVCRNTDGVLFYQGHRQTGPFTAATSNDTILVGAGVAGKVVLDGDEFVASYPKDLTQPDGPMRTDYHVSATTFFYLDLPANVKVTYKIVRTVP